jgi:hypothetical protein
MRSKILFVAAGFQPLSDSTEDADGFLPQRVNEK